MLIVWGTRIVSKKTGRVAEYCPSCRDLRAFAFKEVRQVNHIYFIPLGRGEVVGHETVCETCRTTLNALPEHFEMISRDDGATVDDLVVDTNPDLYGEMAQRLDREERAERGQLTADERREMLFEPFLAISPVVEARAKAGHVDWPVGLSLLSLLFLPWWFIVPGMDGTDLKSQMLFWTGIALAVASVAALIYFAVTDMQRFIRREHQKRLINDLRPLNPTSEELQETLGQLKAAGLMVGRKINARRLYDGLRSSS